MPKGGKSQFSRGKYPRIAKPFSKIKKKSATKEISIYIEEIRAKLDYLNAKKQKIHAPIVP